MAGMGSTAGLKFLDFVTSDDEDRFQYQGYGAPAMVIRRTHCGWGQQVMIVRGETLSWLNVAYTWNSIDG
jgi:hypothetical protein